MEATMRAFAPLVLAGLLCACAPAKSPSTTSEVTGPSDIEIGRYLVRIGGCNDCHTPGYLQADGKLPESQWLTGNPVGFRGPWGVTYASNLRLAVNTLSEDDWVAMLAHRGDAPPMPWPATRAMTPANKRSLYRYIRSLKPAGQAAPARLAPGDKPSTPVVDMIPVAPQAR
jgi:mono/diheme cytochrome c family protein